MSEIMEFFWRRITLALFFLLILGAIFFTFQSRTVFEFVFAKRFSSNQTKVSHHAEADLTEGIILERLLVSSPGIIESISKMNSQQKEKAIELVRQKAIAIATMNGWSDERAREFGKSVAMAISKAASRASVGNDYF
ncbi:hypothetical protein [Bartonella sp. B17]